MFRPFFLFSVLLFIVSLLACGGKDSSKSGKVFLTDDTGFEGTNESGDKNGQNGPPNLTFGPETTLRVPGEEGFERLGGLGLADLGDLFVIGGRYNLYGMNALGTVEWSRHVDEQPLDGCQLSAGAFGVSSGFYQPDIVLTAANFFDDTSKELIVGDRFGGGLSGQLCVFNGQGELISQVFGSDLGLHRLGTEVQSLGDLLPTVGQQEIAVLAIDATPGGSTAIQILTANDNTVTKVGSPFPVPTTGSVRQVARAGAFIVFLPGEVQQNSFTVVHTKIEVHAPKPDTTEFELVSTYEGFVGLQDLGEHLHGPCDLDGDKAADEFLAYSQGVGVQAYRVDPNNQEVSRLFGFSDTVTAASSKVICSDLNGDETHEIVVAAPTFGNEVGTDVGRVVIYSAATQDKLFELTGDAPGSTFGSQLTTLGSVNPHAASLLISAPLKDEDDEESKSQIGEVSLVEFIQ